MSKKVNSPGSPSTVNAPNCEELQQTYACELPRHIEKDSSEQGSGSSSNSKDSTKIRKLHSPSPEENELECLLLQDTSMNCAPLHLRQLLKHFDTNKPTQAELLLLLVYVVALESGFVTLKEGNKCSDYITKNSPLSSFHSKNVLRLSRQVPTYTSDANKSHFTMQLRTIVHAVETPQSKVLYSMLTGFVTGDFMIVTLTPDRSIEKSGCSICLSIGRYVLGTQAKGKPLYQRFRKLNELSLLLRENLYVPMRNQQLALLEVPVYPSLEGLPSELYDEIFQHLNRNQLKIVANVNKHLNYYSTSSKHLEEKFKTEEELCSQNSI